MASVNVTIRLDENLKKAADELFSDLGLSMNAALNMFIKQSVREQRIPFEVTRNRSDIVVASNEDVISVSKRLMKQNKTAYDELAK